MVTKQSDIYRFQLSFKGDLVENSVDAYAVANTILATSQALSQIADLRYGENVSNNIKININAFNKGSLVSDFLIYAQDAVGASVILLPVLKDAYKTGKEMLATFKLIIDIKKELKGKRPKKVVPINNNQIEIHGNNNTVLVVSVDDLRAVQDKTISKSINKIADSLLKEGSEIKEIDVIEEGKNFITINREDAKYLAADEEIQLIPEIRYKGVVSKIDTKACSGFLDLHSRRVSLEYKELPKEQFDILVDSLRNKIQIYITGSVEMDLESNPRRILITKVERDETLF